MDHFDIVSAMQDYADLVTKAVPIDAYAAAKRSDGTIVVQDLSNPATVIVMVVEFEIEKISIGFHNETCSSSKEYTGVYHDGLDCWEIFGSDDDHYSVVHSGDQYYDICQEVAIHFKDKLLAGHRLDKFVDRLTKKIATEIRDEIDRDIMRDLQANSQVAVTVVVPPNNQQIVRSDRKLKVRWSLDPVDAPEVAKPIGVISRL